MSLRSFQGAEIYRLASEMLADRSATIIRDTSIKVTGAASWKLLSTASDFFETHTTKAATDVIAACSLNFRIAGGGPTIPYRICTARDNGGNAGGWYLGHVARQLKIYNNLDAIQVSGTTLDTNTWYHIMLMDDGTTAYVYLNGNTTPDMTWNHGQGAWNNKSWGPSAIQLSGKATSLTHWFDDVVCFDDQDGRMDWITPSDWAGNTTWRVERAIPTGDVVTDFTPSGGGAHYLLVDEDVDDTSDYVATPNVPHGAFHMVREGGTDYILSPSGWGFGYDKSPAGNEWTDTIYDAIISGLSHDGGANLELLDITNVSAWSMGSERIRAVRFQKDTQQPDVAREFYVWRDTVLIGPSDPVTAVTFVPRVMMY